MDMGDRHMPSVDDCPSQTEVSFDPAMPISDDAAERRGEQRSKMSVYRSASLAWAAGEGLCLIRNISPGGMMGRVPREIPPGQRVVVELRSGHPIEGSVAWSREGMVGIQFTEAIDVLEVLHAPTVGDNGIVQRMPRVRVFFPATLLVEGKPREINLLDISQGGAKVQADFLRTGDEVTLVIHGLERRQGRVRWVREGRAGIHFFHAHSFKALADWAAERQAEAAGDLI